MKPGSLPLRAQTRPACQLCDYISQLPAYRRSYVAASTFKAPAIRRQVGRQHGVAPRIPARRITTTPQKQQQQPGAKIAVDRTSRIEALKTKLAQVQKHIEWIKSSPKVESEAVTIAALEGLETIAREAIAIRSGQPLPAKVEVRQSSAGAILSMGQDAAEDDSVKVGKSTKSVSLNELPSPAYLSQLADDLLKHPKVFISSDILGLFIHLQRLLRRPRTIPEILHLYANKPVPEINSSPPKFLKPSPKAPKQAIPTDLAYEALGAAIDAKDLSLALDVIDNSYRAPAWKYNRMLSKLGVPGAIMAVTPLAIYMIAQELSVYSNFIDPFMFKIYSIMGISTYVLCTGTLGFVAMTTYNDNFVRVVWRPGMPLLDRYLREDERAAMDRIACAWGFKEEWRRGDEEGEEWEGLKELCLLRGMILDKPDLMPGMNA
jgi:ribosomal protein L5